MKPTMKIDFVSDISCPWCAIGLASLEQALEKLDGELAVELHFQPFELNPHMPAGGQDIAEHLTQKYGSTPAQQAQIRADIGRRGAALGFDFKAGGRGRIYNTFDAHRLLHWAGQEAPAQQLLLKKALLAACHSSAQDMASHEVLLRAAQAAGLDPQRALSILGSDEFTAQVRQREAFYTDQGIHAVPAVIINDRHLISGGQPSSVYEQALRQIAAASDAP